MHASRALATKLTKEMPGKSKGFESPISKLGDIGDAFKSGGIFGVGKWSLQVFDPKSWNASKIESLPRGSSRANIALRRSLLGWAKQRASVRVLVDEAEALRKKKLDLLTRLANETLKQKFLLCWSGYIRNLKSNLRAAVRIVHKRLMQLQRATFDEWRHLRVEDATKITQLPVASSQWEVKDSPTAQPTSAAAVSPVGGSSPVKVEIASSSARPVQRSEPAAQLAKNKVDTGLASAGKFDAEAGKEPTQIDGLCETDVVDLGPIPEQASTLWPDLDLSTYGPQEAPWKQKRRSLMDSMVEKMESFTSQFRKAKDEQSTSTSSHPNEQRSLPSNQHKEGRDHVPPLTLQTESTARSPDGSPARPSSPNVLCSPKRQLPGKLDASEGSEYQQRLQTVMKKLNVGTEEAAKVLSALESGKVDGALALMRKSVSKNSSSASSIQGAPRGVASASIASSNSSNSNPYQRPTPANGHPSHMPYPNGVSFASHTSASGSVDKRTQQSPTESRRLDVRSAPITPRQAAPQHQHDPRHAPTLAQGASRQVDPQTASAARQTDPRLAQARTANTRSAPTTPRQVESRGSPSGSKQSKSDPRPSGGRFDESESTAVRDARRVMESKPPAVQGSMVGADPRREARKPAGAELARTASAERPSPIPAIPSPRRLNFPDERARAAPAGRYEPPASSGSYGRANMNGEDRSRRQDLPSTPRSMNGLTPNGDQARAAMAAAASNPSGRADAAQYTPRSMQGATMNGDDRGKHQQLALARSISDERARSAQSYSPRNTSGRYDSSGRTDSAQSYTLRTTMNGDHRVQPQPSYDPRKHASTNGDHAAASTASASRLANGDRSAMTSGKAAAVSFSGGDVATHSEGDGARGSRLSSAADKPATPPQEEKKADMTPEEKAEREFLQGLGPVLTTLARRFAFLHRSTLQHIASTSSEDVRRMIKEQDGDVQLALEAVGDGVKSQIAAISRRRRCKLGSMRAWRAEAWYRRRNRPLFRSVGILAQRKVYGRALTAWKERRAEVKAQLDGVQKQWCRGMIRNLRKSLLAWKDATDKAKRGELEAGNDEEVRSGGNSNRSTPPSALKAIAGLFDFARSTGETVVGKRSANLGVGVVQAAAGALLGKGTMKTVEEQLSAASPRRRASQP